MPEGSPPSTFSGKSRDCCLKAAANGLPDGAYSVLVAPGRILVRPRPRNRHFSGLEQAQNAPRSRLSAQTADLALSRSRLSPGDESGIVAFRIPLRAHRSERSAGRSHMPASLPRRNRNVAGAQALRRAAMPAPKLQQYARATAAPAPRPARDPNPSGCYPAQGIIVRLRFVCGSGPATERPCGAAAMHPPLIPGKSCDCCLKAAANGLPDGAYSVLVAPGRILGRPRPRNHRFRCLEQAQNAPRSRLLAQTADLALSRSRFSPGDESGIVAFRVPLRAHRSERSAGRSHMPASLPRRNRNVAGAQALRRAAMPAPKLQQYARATAAPAPRPARDPNSSGCYPAQGIIVRLRFFCGSGPALDRPCGAAAMHPPLIPGKSCDCCLKAAANGLPDGAYSVLVAPGRILGRPRPRNRHFSGLEQAQNAPRSRLLAQTADLALSRSRFSPGDQSGTAAPCISLRAPRPERSAGRSQTPASLPRRNRNVAGEEAPQSLHGEESPILKARQIGRAAATPVPRPVRDPNPSACYPAQGIIVRLRFVCGSGPALDRPCGAAAMDPPVTARKDADSARFLPCICGIRAVGRRVFRAGGAWTHPGAPKAAQSPVSDALNRPKPPRGAAFWPKRPIWPFRAAGSVPVTRAVLSHSASPCVRTDRNARQAVATCLPRCHGATGT